MSNPLDPIFNDPGFEEYAQRVIDELVPMVKSSPLAASIVPEDIEHVDVKFAVELGLMIMYDKPVALVIKPGQQVPEHLARVADAIIELGPNMGEAFQEFADKYGGEES